ncbi:hypothetical protein NQ315_007857 [Exocentrus adspersus]|uniref:Uncharacterized protein n=1 Tax=Exocentrus adspersus TaxID=1586481 RepID=A0AAV8W9H2_9CUCU|nr:hypothetical protein NQ315_007857 [Exocentrus adspersus]
MVCFDTKEQTVYFLDSVQKWIHDSGSKSILFLIFRFILRKR